MFNKITLKDIITLLVLITIATVIGYFYANNQARNKLWVKSYFIRAELSARHITCSDNAPAWLADVLRHQTYNNNAPANQIAYITPDGTAQHCENGYIGQYPLLSDPVTAQTRFRYASVTKLWTADAILQLIKDDKLSLDTLLADIISEIDKPTDSRINDITIRQLLSHRAGFDRYSVFGQDMFGIGEPICPNHINELNNITLGFDPDTKTSYSNLGYCLLGEVVSRLNNQPYTDLIAEQYDFADSSLRFISDKPMSDEVTYNYVETGLTGISDIYTAFDYEGLASAAGLSGTAIDVAQQAQRMAAKSAPNILSIDANSACDITQIAECYGLAMVPYQPQPNLLMVHYRDGNLFGLSSLVAIDERGATVALLSNGTADTGIDHNLKVMIYEQMTAAR